MKPTHRVPRRLLGAALCACAAALAGCGGGNVSGNVNVVVPPPPEVTGTLLKVTELGAPLAAPDTRQLLLQLPEVAALPQAQRDALAAEVQFGVRGFAFEYTTKGPNGEPRKASALALLPVSPTGAVATVAYMHGTSTKRSEIPSAGQYDENQEPALLFAARGRLVVAPDYLGLGTSDLSYHPYLHRDTLAASGRDALIAAAELAKQKALALNGDLFVMGYSEGGFAAGALQRRLAQAPINALALRGTMSIAGPLDLSKAVDFALSTDPATGRASGRSVYSAFTIWAYQRVYGNLYSQATEVFNPPYAGQLDALFDGTRAADEIAAALPASPRQLLTQGALAATLNGSNSIAARIRDNDVIDLNPAASMVSCHGTDDDTVPFASTTSARSRLAARGFTLTVVELTGKDHVSAYVPCMLEAVQRFR